MKALKRERSAINAGGTEFTPTHSQDPQAFAVVVEGDSMYPEFKAGDRVVLEPNHQAETGCAALVKLKDGRVFLSWYEREGECVRLISENKAVSAFTVAASEVQFAYPACELKRSINRRSTSTAPSQLREPINCHPAQLTSRRLEIVRRSAGIR
jgi:SOS-response transcriptional repressor LexA